MKKKTKITYISQLYDLVTAANQCYKPVYISQESITVDGRSLLGILSLDLFQPIYVSADEKEFDKFTSFLEFQNEEKDK